MLKHNYTSSQLVPFSENILNYEKIITTAGKKITFREASIYIIHYYYYNTIVGSLGYTKCIYKTKFKSNS